MNRIYAKCLQSLLTGLLVMPAVAQQHSSRREASEVVWTWSKQCDGKHKLGLTVELKGKVLYRGVLPICRGSRDAEMDGRSFTLLAITFFKGKYACSRRTVGPVQSPPTRPYPTNDEYRSLYEVRTTNRTRRRLTELGRLSMAITDGGLLVIQLLRPHKTPCCCYWSPQP